MELPVIEINETEDTPRVYLNAAEGNFSIIGKSLPEDPAEFFDPIHNWFDNYLKQPNSSTTITLELDYFNSASSKQIVELLMKLENPSDGHETKVLWRFHEDDELMELRGEELKNVLDVTFEFESFS